MKIKKSTRYILAIILIIIMITIISSLALRYHINAKEIFYFNTENVIKDGSFENFNQTVGDCCTTPEKAGEAIIYASKSTDAFDGKYSLNLTSGNHCACISEKIRDISILQKYLVSFKYKGDNGKFCNWVEGDNACLPLKKMEKSDKWIDYRGILSLTNKSSSASIYFYSDSDGTKTVTNIYDDLQVHQLVQMDTSYKFKNNEKYVIKTDPSNVVHNGDPLDDEGYYLVTGKPEITLKFPWPELILLLFMMLVVIRLLFKRPDVKKSNDNIK